MAAEVSTVVPAFVAGAKTVGRIVAVGSGTTSGSIDTASTVAHGALDVTGAAYTAANLMCLAFQTATSTDPIYQGAAPTASVIDIRCHIASIPYIWVLIHKNS